MAKKKNKIEKNVLIETDNNDFKSIPEVVVTEEVVITPEVVVTSEVVITPEVVITEEVVVTPEVVIIPEVVVTPEEEEEEVVIPEEKEVTIKTQKIYNKSELRFIERTGQIPK